MFSITRRHHNEALEDWAKRVENLARFCSLRDSFGVAKADILMRDKFVTGIRSTPLVDHLRSQDIGQHTFKTVFIIAKSFEDGYIIICDSKKKSSKPYSFIYRRRFAEAASRKNEELNEWADRLVKLGNICDVTAEFGTKEDILLRNKFLAGLRSKHQLGFVLIHNISRMTFKEVFYIAQFYYSNKLRDVKDDRLYVLAQAADLYKKVPVGMSVKEESLEKARPKVEPLDPLLVLAQASIWVNESEINAQNQNTIGQIGPPAPKKLALERFVWRDHNYSFAPMDFE